jgi:hypothetical protein
MKESRFINFPGCLVLFIILFQCNHRASENSKVDIQVDSLYQILLINLNANEQESRENYTNPYHDLNDNQIIHDLIKKLKFSEDKLRTGTAEYYEFVFWELMRSIIKLDQNGQYIQSLWDDNRMNWDGAWSIWFSDLIVKEGKRMIPILSRVKSRINEKERLMKLIESGIQTAI